MNFKKLIEEAAKKAGVGVPHRSVKRIIGQRKEEFTARIATALAVGRSNHLRNYVLACRHKTGSYTAGFTVTQPAAALAAADTAAAAEFIEGTASASAQPDPDRAVGEEQGGEGLSAMA